MRLLVFTENYYRGGGNRYLIDLVNGASAPFKSVVLASNPGGVFPEDLERLERPVEPRSVPILTSARVRSRGGFAASLMRRMVTLIDPIVLWLNVRRLGRLIADVRPDALVVCNGGFPAARSVLAAAIAAKRAGLPVGMAVVGVPVPRRPRLFRYEQALDRRVWDSVDLVAVSGSAILRGLETLRGLPRGLGRVIPNALPDRAPVHRERGAVVTVGCVTRVDRLKGMPELADAFVKLAPAFPEARLRVIGDGDAREEMRTRLVAAGLGDRAELPGHVGGDDAVAEEVAGIDIYVLPSHMEGGGPPYSILEAMRAGCAIVTTSVGSIGDGVTDGCEGLVVSPADVDALAAAIRRLLSNAPLRRRLGEAARKRFLQDFTLARSHERAAELAQDLLERRTVVAD